MASPKAVATMLAMFHESYPTRPLTAKTGRVWEALMRDVDDDLLLQAARVVANQPGRTFFPTPGELRACLATFQPPMPDSEDLLRRISALGTHNPNTGWIYPRVERVREAFGAAVAQAYGLIGPRLLYSDHPNTQDIARRDFREALAEAEADMRTGEMLTSGMQRKQLGDGESD